MNMEREEEQSNHSSTSLRLNSSGTSRLSSCSDSYYSRGISHSDEDRSQHSNSQCPHNCQHYKHQPIAPKDSINNTRHTKDTSTEPEDAYDEYEDRQVTDTDSDTIRNRERRGDQGRRSDKRVRAGSDDEADSDVSDTRHESKYYKSADYKRDARSEDRDAGHSRRGTHEHSRSLHGALSKDDREYPGYHDDVGEFNSKVFCKKKLWVGGLPSDVNCEELRRYFEVYGKLIYVMISPKGNAFIKYDTEEAALFAYRKCYTAYYKGKLIKVKYAIRKSNKMPHNKLLYINNVPASISRTDLRREFEKYGELEDVQMYTAPYVYFFVTFVFLECAVRARKALKSKYFIQYGKMRVDEKRPESPKPRPAEKKERTREKCANIAECKVNDVLEPLSDDQTLELSDLLNSLETTNANIRERRTWIFRHTENINDILLHISVMLVAKDNSFNQRLATLYLIHDLLSYCTQRRACAEILDTVSALTLPHLQRVINKFHIRSEEEKKSVLNILSLWEKFSVYPVAVVEDLRHKFIAGDKADEVW